jgi:hypothetical protein
MINLKVPSKYKLLATREDKVHNDIHDLILGRLGISEYKRYLILLSVGRETKWRMILATDEVNIMKRLPQIIKRDWNEYYGRDRYDRPKQADPRQHKPNNVRSRYGRNKRD